MISQREPMTPAKASSLSDACLLVGLILNVGSVDALSTVKIGKVNASARSDMSSL